MQIRVYNVLDYSDVDDLIRKHFSRLDYECISGEEWGNDSEHSFYLEGELSEYDQDYVEAFRTNARDGSNMLSLLLEQLVIDGLLPKGYLLVTVCW